MEVEGLLLERGAHLRDHLLLGAEAGLRALLHLPDQLVGAGEEEVDRGMVVEVRADALEAVRDLDPERLQHQRIADPGALQDGGGAVGAAADDRAAGPDRRPAAVDDRLGADDARALDQQAVGERVADDRQVRAVADRIEVRERRVEADARRRR